MNKTQTAELLDLVINRAPKLRAAGVLEFEVSADGLVAKAKLANLDPEPPAPTAATKQTTDGDGTDDATSSSDLFNDPDLGLDYDPKKLRKKPELPKER